jgi:hypothetical protein
MTRARIGLLSLCVLAAAVPARAQGQSGWEVSADALNVLTRGNDVHAGDVFTENQSISGTLTSSSFEYGVTYDPIVTKMDDRISALISAVYHGSNWGFGGRGWRVSTGGSVSGSARTAAGTFSSASITGIRMWDHSLIPVENDFEPSGISPVTYHAGNTLENTRVDGFAERRWISTPSLHVGMRFGLTYARFENTRSEGHEESASFIDTDSEPGSTIYFSNSITIEMDSKSTMDLIGPSFGIAGDATHRRLRIDWLINPAVMIGTATTTGSWVDTDNISTVTTTGSLSVAATDRLHGVLPVDLEEPAVIPALDLQLKASVRVAGPLRVGAGLFSSSWFHVPMAPAVSVPGQWTDLDGTGWRPQPRDLTFLAYSGFVSLGF